jgi:hypothetical protein
VKTAVEILQKAKRAGITAGRSPAGLAAAAVYIASLMHGDVRSRKKIADVSNTAAITLKEAYKKLIRVVISRLNVEKEVEVNGRKYVVKVVDGGAEIEERQGGKKLLRIRITAEVGRVEGGQIVDRVVREYTINFGRYGKLLNAVLGFATAKADAPGGREADAERLVVVIKALTGKEPRISRRSDGKIEVVCRRVHLDGFRRYAELADAVERWLKK